MTERPRVELAGIVLDSPDARTLADFYRHLLGGTIVADEPNWVILALPGGGRPRLSFQSEPNYEPPVWPSLRSEQQMMIHLDLAVDDVDAAGAHALTCGAAVADVQPQEHVRVYLDPAGHPFCLFPG